MLQCRESEIAGSSDHVTLRYRCHVTHIPGKAELPLAIYTACFSGLVFKLPNLSLETILIQFNSIRHHSYCASITISELRLNGIPETGLALDLAFALIRLLVAEPEPHTQSADHQNDHNVAPSSPEISVCME